MRSGQVLRSGVWPDGSAPCAAWQQGYRVEELPARMMGLRWLVADATGVVGFALCPEGFFHQAAIGHSAPRNHDLAICDKRPAWLKEHRPSAARRARSVESTARLRL